MGKPWEGKTTGRGWAVEHRPALERSTSNHRSSTGGSHGFSQSKGRACSSRTAMACRSKQVSFPSAGYAWSLERRMARQSSTSNHRSSTGDSLCLARNKGMAGSSSLATA
ncbi:hypothetical protein C4D60_Mb09t22990 [Musa balbisiana]|uniref:Uncharacterized protein n=1 Tax=Musa balbisiana TaxID=52838 RepID=A0A4S8IKV6_MUSBA|nr:hypothetical protein C4D60_Mb09t22990 [Musa balbisiana]